MTFSTSTLLQLALAMWELNVAAHAAAVVDCHPEPFDKTNNSGVSLYWAVDFIAGILNIALPSASTFSYVVFGRYDGTCNGCVPSTSCGRILPLLFRSSNC